MEPFFTPTNTIVVAVLGVGVTVLFVWLVRSRAADVERKRARLVELGLQIDDPNRLFAVGTRGGREVTVEVTARAAKYFARAVLPIPAVLLVSRNVHENEWGRLGLSQDPRKLHEVPTGDARFDEAFRTFVRDPKRLPFVDDAKLRATFLDLWAGGAGLAVVDAGGADVNFIVESHPGLWTALERPLDVAVAMASLRA